MGCLFVFVVHCRQHTDAQGQISDLVIHQIFSLAHDWSKADTCPNILELLGNIRSRDVFRTIVGERAKRHFVCACARWVEYFEFGAFSTPELFSFAHYRRRQSRDKRQELCCREWSSAPFFIFLNALRRVFKRVIYVVRKILSREMKDYNKFTHISNPADIHSVCRDFGWWNINH